MSSCRLLLTSPNWKENPDGKIKFWSSIRDQRPIPQDQLLAGEFEEIRGSWAAVIEDDKGVTLIEDRCCSRPLLYARNDKGWVVSDSPKALRGSHPLWTLNEAQAVVFLDLGHTLNEDTLIEGVRSVEAGSSTTLNDNSVVADSEFYGVFLHSDRRIDDPSHFATIFAAGLDETIGALVEDANGRELVVPLSGGDSSRLLATWLKRMGAPNVTTLTYGVEGAPEVAISQSVAEQLELPSLFIPYLPQVIHEKWFSRDADAFMEATWSGTSLPQVQNWYALREMREKQLISDDAIIVPGYTIAGHMHDEHLLDESPSSETIILAAMGQQVLRSRTPDSLRVNSEFRLAFHRALVQTDYGGDPKKLQAALEWFKLREHLAKYTNTSMRGYEHFGWDWALPMYTAPMWDIWSQGAANLTATREWYTGFTDHAFSEVAGIEIQHFSPPAPSWQSGLKGFLSNAMRGSSLERASKRQHSVKFMLDHPMAFQAFVRTDSVPKLVGEYLTGQTNTGIWARSFLNNEWGSNECDVVPPRSQKSSTTH